MTTFYRTSEPLNAYNIENIENITGLNFPDEYKRHLLQFNGGKCSPNIFEFYENGEKTESVVNYFLAINGNHYYDIESCVKTFKIDTKRMPDRMLPIAEDPLGNLICISCSGDDIGYIYFWDHELEVDYIESDDSVQSNMYLISNSFDEFIRGLKEDNEE